RPANAIVEDAVSGEVFDGAVLQFNGKLDNDGAARAFKKIQQTAFELRHVGDGAIKLLGRDVKRIQIFPLRVGELAGRQYGFGLHRAPSKIKVWTEQSLLGQPIAKSKCARTSTLPRNMRPLVPKTISVPINHLAYRKLRNSPKKTWRFGV